MRYKAFINDSQIFESNTLIECLAYAMNYSDEHDHQEVKIIDTVIQAKSRKQVN